ncbi:hypothetical protein Q1695_008113 [Nippostrongylus brasiliensis]|nr:hypothetical protein Q1695_008113 [Nippostrongylus brasiliensis]
MSSNQQLSQTQCIVPPPPVPHGTGFAAGGAAAATYQPLQSPPPSAAMCFTPAGGQVMQHCGAAVNYPSLNTTSPSTDSLFSVSTSLNSLPSECPPPRRSDLDLKMETPDGDEVDDFFDLEKHQKGRSASFGGLTQYGTQLAMARHGLFAPSLDTIGSVASG